MTKNVLDIGNCDPDHRALSNMLTKHYDVKVLRAHQWDDAQVVLQQNPIDLILINRKLDIDYSDGIDVLKQIKLAPNARQIPVMLVTNYQEHQEAAVLEGAEYGFGKLEFSEPATHNRLSKFLEKAIA